MIYVKLHQTEHSSVVVAMCDEGLIDKVLDDGKVFMDIKQYSGFYKGELVSKEDAKTMLEGKKVHSANVVGDEAVDVAVSKAIIEGSSILQVNGVPYAQAFSLEPEK